MKVQPIYLGPFQIVKVIGDNAYELDLPSSVKKHRVINVKWLKPLRTRAAGKYPKELPRTSVERMIRANEVTAILGYDQARQVYYCQMQDVNP
ncbi:hypothetical protein DAKH74_037830 [Maudiozyma humilis]|uniref:Tf2-1-like SH3-like domain-containing protein n=1 Tax=Maudiozyma humilis TaxID=51915 RepID=A0AAV5S0M5_MAUHU|nr:hypothetical protein DAKH74_037830 [Kazachstania humilis]